MQQFDNKIINKKISESKFFLRSLSLDYKKNFINIKNKISDEVEEIENLIQLITDHKIRILMCFFVPLYAIFCH